MSCLGGLPMYSQIKVSWFWESEPGKMGLRPISSAKIHPTDHMSRALVYDRHPMITLVERRGETNESLKLRDNKRNTPSRSTHC
jgi:hypothetical protein